MDRVDLTGGQSTRVFSCAALLNEQDVLATASLLPLLKSLTLDFYARVCQNDLSVSLSADCNVLSELGFSISQSEAVSLIILALGILDASKEFGNLLREVPLREDALDSLYGGLLNVMISIRVDVSHQAVEVAGEACLKCLDLSPEGVHEVASGVAGRLEGIFVIDNNYSD